MRLTLTSQENWLTHRPTTNWNLQIVICCSCERLLKGQRRVQGGNEWDNTKENTGIRPSGAFRGADHFWRVAGDLDIPSAGDTARGCHVLFISLLKFHLCMTSEIGPFDPILEPLACPTVFFHWNVFSLTAGSQRYRGFMLSAFLPSLLFSFSHVDQPQTHTKASDWWSDKDRKNPLLGAVCFNVQIVKSCSYID